MKTTETQKQKFNVLTITDAHNTLIGNIFKPGYGWFKRFRGDGREFLLQSNYCRDYYEKMDNTLVTALVIPDEKKSAMHKRWWLNKQFKRLKSEGKKFDRILFFCHGAKYNLNRKMYSMTKTKDVNTVGLCNLLSGIASPDCGIVFYSCKTAAVLNGFADTVYESTGLDVIGHATSGHTTRNPYKKMFGVVKPGTKKGNWIACDMWRSHGGIKPMKKLMNSDKYAPLRVVEEWLGES